MSTPRASLFAGRTPLVLGVLWIAVMVGVHLFAPESPPRKAAGTDALVVLLVAAPPFAVLWLALKRNAAGFRTWSWGVRAGNALLLFVQWIAWLLAFLLLPALWIPSHATYNTRAKLSEMLLAVGAHRPDAIGNPARTLPAGGRIDAGYVGDNGVVVAYNNEFGALIVMSPMLVAGRIAEWKCTGYPPRYMPGSCREVRDTSFSDRFRASIEEDAAALKRFADSLAAAAPATSRILPPSATFDFGYHGADGAIALYSDRTGVFLLKTALGCTLWPGEANQPGCAAGAPRGD